MERQPEGTRERFNPWPIIGVLSVLVPALIFAYFGYRGESQRQDLAGQRLDRGTPEEVTSAFLGALADGRTDLARRALADGAKVNTDDPGYRGLRNVRVSGEGGDGEATDGAMVLAEFVTVRPWASGEAPGPQKRRVVLRRQDERWLVVRITPVD